MHNAAASPRVARAKLVCGALAMALCLAPAAAAAQQADAQTTQIEEIIVRGNLRSLPGEKVESVLGFGKSLLELPRSASTVSAQQITRFGIDDIDELIVLAPGSFTQSFFGVAGSLDVRGTPGEVYFRGVRRLDNPGNYPTPIGASDRVDIVRGPASPIFGPAKIGGYLNFEPKSARAEDGRYLSAHQGALSFAYGSWQKRVFSGEIGGPAKLGEKELGYYLYAEVEDSNSYYQNTADKQTILQASFDMDATDNVRLQWGGMYHEWEGNQIAGWNRLTQELINSGTYITGNPAPLDSDGDGFISHQEYDAVGLFVFTPGILPGADTDINNLTAFGDLSVLALPPEGVGTAQLRGHQVLVAPDDTLENEVLTLYFDVIAKLENGIQVKNQLFFETYDNLNENAYGFSQFHDSYALEEKLVISGEFTRGSLIANWVFSPSLRYTNFLHGDDFTNEHFNRRDLTGPSTALDRRLLATRIGRDYTTYSDGDYLDFGVAALVDLAHESGFSGTFGLRWDSIDMESFQPGALLLGGTPEMDLHAKDTVDGFSWSASLGYALPFGLRPYLTFAEQSTIIAGQGAELEPDRIMEGGAFDTSELLEAGLKASLLEDKLYFALAYYKQERTDFSAQSTVTNQATETKGWEFELRWALSDALLATAGWSQVEVININTEEAGQRFSFVGAEDLPAIPAHLLYAGTLAGDVLLGDRRARRAGTPENIYSTTATYDFGFGFAANLSAVHAEAVPSGYSASVTLPSYTLLNLGGIYESENWRFTATVNNVTDERYFRANFPNLFGSQIVLPELPRNYGAKLEYRF